MLFNMAPFGTFLNSKSSIAATPTAIGAALVVSFLDGWDYAKVNPVTISMNYSYISGSTGTAGTCNYSVGIGKVYLQTTYYSDTSSATMQANLHNYVMSVAVEADTTYFR